MTGTTYQSNSTALRLAEEATPKALPDSPVWFPYEPNSYGDFGAEYKRTRREPITPDRQKRRGSITDLDASAAFNQDFTSDSLSELMQGFMFADWRLKDELTVTEVTATDFTFASGGDAIPAGSLVYSSGHSEQANNGLKLVTASSGTTVSVAGLTVEAAPVGAKVTRVGLQADADDLTVTVTDGVATIGATTLALNTLGLIPGEWLWLGGDEAVTQSDADTVNGAYRVKEVSATEVVCDRAPDGVVTDACAGKTMRVFLGHVIKNEADPALQVCRTYQAERKLRSNKLQYIEGCGADELKITVKSNDNIKMEVGLMGLDQSFEDAAKSGDRPDLPEQVVYSATTDYTRLRLLNGNGEALAAFLTDLELTIANGLEPNKAIGSVGGFDYSYGDFMVSGSVEAYVSTTEAVESIKDNPEVSLDQLLAANVNTPGEGIHAVGWLIDVPLIGLMDGRLKVEKDKAIKLPLTLEAEADRVLDHTCLVQRFKYLPQLAV